MKFIYCEVNVSKSLENKNYKKKFNVSISLYISALNTTTIH